MLNILKAEFKKLRSAVFMYILIGLAIILPLINSGFLALINKIVGEGEAGNIFDIFNTPYSYATSFSPLNNIGLLLIITIVVLGANDFSQNTIRNKIIAGYPKHTIFLASLVYNLIIMFGLMFVYTTATYLSSSLFNGFIAGEFWIIFRFGVIAYSSLMVIYTVLTVLTYHFKNIIAPLLITLGSLLGLIAFYSILINIPKNIIDFTFLQHVFPVIRMLSPNFSINESMTSIVIETNLWWVDLLVNMGHIAWLSLLGISVSRQTDYK